MRIRQTRSLASQGSALGAIILAVALPWLAQAAETPQAGVTAAVRGEVSRAPAAQPEAAQAMAVGQGVFMQDRLRSAAASQAQLLLLDQSSFTVGPNSDLVIDEFVYDPGTDSGKLVANVARGTLRFVSGGIGRLGADRITIRTEVSVIGIRGTIALRDETRNAADKLTEERVILAGPGAKNNANAKPGEITVAAVGKTVTISRTGWGTIVRPGEPPTDPAPMSPEAVQAANDRLNAGVAAAGQGTAPAPSGVRLEGEQSAASAAGDATAKAGEQAKGVLAEASADTTTSTVIATANELESQQTGGGSFCCFSGAGFTNNLGQEISDMTAVQQLSSGTVSASATGLPIVDISIAPSGSTGNSSLFIPDLSGLPTIGSYNYSFQANLSTKTYTISLSGVTLGGATGAISQSASFATSGVGFIDFSVGSTGVTADAGCTAVGCFVQNDLLTIAGNPVGGISHRLTGTDPISGITGLGAASLLTSSGP